MCHLRHENVIYGTKKYICGTKKVICGTKTLFVARKRDLWHVRYTCGTKEVNKVHER